jgi:hypothetical protein
MEENRSIPRNMMDLPQSQPLLRRGWGEALGIDPYGSDGHGYP